MHQSQVFRALLAAFIGGIAFASVVPISDRILLWSCIAGVAVLAVSVYRRTFGQTERGIHARKRGFLIGCIILVAVAGAWRYNQYSFSHSVLEPFADARVGLNREKEVPVTVLGYVDDDPTIAGIQTRFAFRVKEVLASRVFLTDERVLVSLKGAPKVQYGQYLILQGAVHRPQNFSTFDYAAFLRKEGIRTTMDSPTVISDAPRVSQPHIQRYKAVFWRNIFALKHSFEDAIGRVVSEPNAAFTAGILTGTKTAIPDWLREAFQRTGTSHILALSGYNIAIVSEAVLAILLLAFRRKTAFWFVVAVVVIFTVATGASASVVRAAVMGLLLLAAFSSGRRYDASVAVIMASAVMTAANPLILRFDVGFQLSFLAVLGLLYIRPILEKAARRLPSMRGIKEVALTTVAAQIAVFPLLLYVFNSLSLVALPVNIIVLPLVPLAMLLGFVTGLGALASVFVGKTIGLLTWAVTWFQLSIISWASALPSASLAVSISLPTMTILYVLMAAGVTVLNRTYAGRI